ncbi:hypothetical protein HYH03_016213 [Edaphochlamys debaryana]|uniref:Thiaminase-2/PQQC domain-containing protein n=1 Tax=Edaphochlamys debaryana TaxID=47281 RepID=A0A835XKE3_9CHLO|nr:hypothetical protein HYH03_016213 [Edaphochlamys debaryana]|eukprot:KAG2485010.1 hypothetical protein HYH03_016213 [Edaphochlamys debaryana]
MALLLGSLAAASPRAHWPDGAAEPVQPKAGTKLFAEELWDSAEAQEQLKLAKESAFIKGIAENTLDPRLYGVYQLQDAAYLSSAQECFQAITTNPGNSKDLQDYYALKAISYQGYSRDMKHLWHINSLETVRLSPAAYDYIRFEGSMVTSLKDKPWYFLLANYPCYRLWPEMSAYLKTTLNATLGDYQKSIYKGWIDDNSSFKSAASLAAMIEPYRGYLAEPNKPDAKQLFLKALEYEVAFFDSVGALY